MKIFTSLGVVALGAAGTLFTLSLTGDIPGLWGLLSLAALPAICLALAALSGGGGSDRAAGGRATGC